MFVQILQSKVAAGVYRDALMSKLAAGVYRDTLTGALALSYTHSGAKAAKDAA